jgi:hypothetical protein
LKALQNDYCEKYKGVGIVKIDFSSDRQQALNLSKLLMIAGLAILCATAFGAFGTTYCNPQPQPTSQNRTASK